MGLPRGGPISYVMKGFFMLNMLGGDIGVYKSIFMTVGIHENMRVAMVCFGAGLMFLFYGRYVWKYDKPDYIPGYTKREYEDTKYFSKLAGQAHMLAGGAMLLLSVPLNEITPNPVVLIVSFIGCIVLIVMAILRYIKAIKSRRR